MESPHSSGGGSEVAGRPFREVASTQSNSWQRYGNPSGHSRVDKSNPLLAEYLLRTEPSHLRPTRNPKVRRCRGGSLVEEDGHVKGRTRFPG
jgi:hypothetical protein